MPAPEFTLPTTGTSPQIADLGDLEGGINGVSQALWNDIQERVAGETGSYTEYDLVFTDDDGRIGLGVTPDGDAKAKDFVTHGGVSLADTAGSVLRRAVLSARSEWGGFPRPGMDTPPTLTLTQTGTTPAGTSLLAYNSVGYWRTEGGFTSQYGANPYLQFKCSSPLGNVSGWTASNQGNGAAKVETIFTGTVLRIKLRGNGTALRVLVGDASGQNYEYAATSFLTAPGDGLPYILEIDFGTSGTRAVIVEGQGTFQFGGMYVATGDSVVAPAGSKPLVCCLGTSVTENYLSWALWLSYTMGWDVYNVGVGASGILADSNGTRTKQIDRSNDFTVGDFVLGIDENGINDDNAALYSAYDYATVKTEFGTAYREVIDAWFAAHPESPFIGWGPFWPHATPTPTLYAIRDAKREVLAEYPLTAFVDTLTPSIIGGRRSEGTYPASTYISADNTHPNETGQKFIGLHLDARVHDLLKTIF